MEFVWEKSSFLTRVERHAITNRVIKNYEKKASQWIYILFWLGTNLIFCYCFILKG